MLLARLVGTALAMTVAGACSVTFACDKDMKATSAGAVTTAAPAESHCAGHAAAADAGACLGKSSAVTASSGMCRHAGAATAAGGACSDKASKSAMSG